MCGFQALRTLNDKMWRNIADISVMAKFEVRVKFRFMSGLG